MKKHIPSIIIPQEIGVDEKSAGRMTRALCMVAHPDDCLIFGYHYILSHRQYQWTIGYLILDDHSPRVEEMRSYWARHEIDVFSLDLPHDPPPSDLSNGRCSIPFRQATDTIEAVVRDYDHLLSHGRPGEYGHPHHVFLHGIMRDLGRSFVAFDVGPDAPQSFGVPRDEYETLTLHHRAIRNFVKRFGLETSAGYRVHAP